MKKQTVVINRDLGKDLLSLLESTKEPMNAHRAAFLLKCEPIKIYQAVSRNRKRFLLGKTDTRVWTTKDGYMLSPSKEGIKYESAVRVANLTGLIRSSAPVLKFCKRVDRKHYAMLEEKVMTALTGITVKRIS